MTLLLGIILLILVVLALYCGLLRDELNALKRRVEALERHDPKFHATCAAAKVSARVDNLSRQVTDLEGTER